MSKRVEEGPEEGWEEAGRPGSTRARIQATERLSGGFSPASLLRADPRVCAHAVRGGGGM